MLVLMSLGTMSIMAGRLVIVPPLPLIIDDLAITPFAAGIALSLMWALTATFQHFSGRTADELSRKMVLLTGLLVAVVGLALLATATSYPLFLLTTATIGASAGIYPVVAYVQTTDLYGEQRGAAFGFLSASMDLGGTLSPRDRDHSSRYLDLARRLFADSRNRAPRDVPDASLESGRVRYRRSKPERPEDGQPDPGNVEHAMGAAGCRIGRVHVAGDVEFQPNLPPGREGVLADGRQCCFHWPVRRGGDRTAGHWSSRRPIRTSPDFGADGARRCDRPYLTPSYGDISNSCRQYRPVRRRYRRLLADHADDDILGVPRREYRR